MIRKHLTRREFVRLAGTSALTVGPAASIYARSGQALKPVSSGSRHQVALVPCPDYSPSTLGAAIREGWRSSRPPDVKGKRVVIKPNIADFAPDKPIHTDTRIVESLILLLKSQGALEIILAEGPPHNRDTEWLFRATGYEALAKRQGVRLIDLNYDDVSPVRGVTPNSTYLKEMHLPRTILSADVLISAPKMKTHRHAGITLSMKNMFGILPGMRYGWPKNVLHWNGIPLSVCEINGTVKTHYAIVDGVIGMEGYGPLMGSAKKAGVLIMGDNALAVDATAARVMGIEPARVEHLAMADKFRFGSLRLDDIAIVGSTVETARTDFVLDPEFAHLRASKV